MSGTVIAADHSDNRRNRRASLASCLAAIVAVSARECWWPFGRSLAIPGSDDLPAPSARRRPGNHIGDRGQIEAARTDGQPGVSADQTSASDLPRRRPAALCAVSLRVTASPREYSPDRARSGHGGLAVFAVAAYVEPEVTRQGEQALHEIPLDFDGMLGSV
jgi:hypothetical protein